jgi:hypothetical protein
MLHLLPLLPPASWSGPWSSLFFFCSARGIVGEGGWGRVDYSRSNRIIGADSVLLMHLLFIGAAEDNDLLTPQDSVVEFVKEPLSKLKVARSSSDEILLIWRWR